jgi:hypothetical protein
MVAVFTQQTDSLIKRYHSFFNIVECFTVIECIFMPSRLFYINKGPGRVSQAIELKQSGKCRCCGKDFTPDEQIVSNGKRKKYYHSECAQRLHILIRLPKALAKKESIPALILQEPPTSELLVSLK